MRKKMIKGHQGDVIFKQIKSLPEGFEKTENKPLAVGSAGHCHVITGNVQRYEKDDRVIYIFKDSSPIQHTDISLMNENTYSSPNILPEKDHRPLLLPGGIYEFFIQKTYNPYKKIMENVKD